MDTVLVLIKEMFGNAAVALVLLIGLAVSATWFICRKYSILKGKTDNIDSLPCQEHHNALTEQNRQAHEIDVRLAKIDTEITHINLTLAAWSASPRSGGAEPLTQSHSPISLTDAGKTVDARLSLSESIASNWSKISAIISGTPNPYDIQMAFMRELIAYPEKYFDDATLNKVKTDAYGTGRALAEYMRVAAIIARDRYFEEHGIQPLDVDKHDPSQH